MKIFIISLITMLLGCTPSRNIIPIEFVEKDCEELSKLLKTNYSVLDHVNTPKCKIRFKDGYAYFYGHEVEGAVRGLKLKHDLQHFEAFRACLVKNKCSVYKLTSELGQKCRYSCKDKTGYGKYYE